MKSVQENVTVVIEMFRNRTGPADYRSKRVFGFFHIESHSLVNQCSKSFQKRTTAGKPNTILGYI